MCDRSRLLLADGSMGVLDVAAAAARGNARRTLSRGSVPQPAPPGKVDVAPGAGWPTAPTKTLTEKLGRDKSSCPVVEATVSQCVERTRWLLKARDL